MDSKFAPKGLACRIWNDLFANTFYNFPIYCCSFCLMTLKRTNIINHKSVVECGSPSTERTVLHCSVTTAMNGQRTWKHVLPLYTTGTAGIRATKRKPICLKGGEEWIWGVAFSSPLEVFTVQMCLSEDTSLTRHSSIRSETYWRRRPTWVCSRARTGGFQRGSALLIAFWSLTIRSRQFSKTGTSNEDKKKHYQKSFY